MQEERRRYDDKNWDEIKKFITESREYRAADVVTQKYQVENIEALKEQVKLQNGRVFSLEKWREEIQSKIKERKNNWDYIQAWITIIATIVMASSAAIMLFKK